jgi:hypothetical protein
MCYAEYVCKKCGCGKVVDSSDWWEGRETCLFFMTFLIYKQSHNVYWSKPAIL